MKHIKLLLITFFSSVTFSHGQIVAWEMNGNAGNEVSVNATTLDANLNTSIISRGSGVNPSNLNDAFSSNNFTNGGTQANAISNNEYLQFQVSASANHKVSLSTLDATFRRSGTGPDSFIWKYSTDGVNFIDIGTTIIYNISPNNGTTQTQIDLSGITALQDVNSGTIITFRLYGWGATSATGTGSFAIGRRAGDDLALGGVVSLICPTSVTWDGTSWSNGTGPTATDTAIIDGLYSTSTSNFTACSLNITSNGILNIIGNTYVEVINDIDNAGQIIIADEGSLVQVNEFTTFTNSSVLPTPVTVARRTAPVATGAWYEYTYWSSPVPEATLENLLPNTNATRKFTFDGSQFHDNQAEVYNTGTFTTNARDDIDDDANAWQFSSGIMIPALGYAATLGPDDLLGPGGGSTGIIKNFEGSTLNTGTIDITVYRNDLSNLDNNWNLIGNPYPSAIDVSLFFAENQQGVSPSGVLDGSIYLWSHSTPPSATTSGNEQLNFDVSDYAIINLSANTAGEDGAIPNNTIGSGQGFFVLYSESAASTTSTVRFTNAMRITSDNQQFYRTSNTDQDNKLWLNLTSDTGVFSQLAVAYVNGATNNDDGPSYDARRFYSGASAMLVSYAENSIIPLAIQGKQPDALDSNEVIALGLKTGITSPTIYTISIDHLQGDFLSNNAIYLKDNLLNTYQDLTTGDYSFTSAMGEFNNRFEIVFTQPSLSINDVSLTENNLLIIEGENDNVIFKLNNEQLTIKNIKIYDTLGRLLYDLKGNNSTETYNLSNLSHATYIAKAVLSNGQILSKKAIKK